MDNTVALIADYAHALRFSDLPTSVVHQCKRCMVDSFGCALGAFDAEPSRIARAIAQRTSVQSGACVIGTAHRTLPELAAFANGVMVRYLDGNDAFPGAAGHLSDSIAAILAAADISGANGAAVITATTLAYEVGYNLCMATDMRNKGLDNVFITGIGGAVGAAKVLGLDRARMMEAISLAITPNVSLVATRYGILSMWKGCAAGNAARNGLFATLLAQAGMTGPEKPIQGSHGLENLIGKFELAPFAGEGRPYRITENTFKCYLVEANALSPITVALELSRQIAFQDIETVKIFTFWRAWEVIGREPEKWRPATREAADHSMPYIVAAVLIDGSFSDEIFSEERLCDPRIRSLIDKIQITEDIELTKRVPKAMPCRIEITKKNGSRIVGETENPRGHRNNPMTDAEVNAKFENLARRALPKERVSLALEMLWQLENAPNLTAIFEAVQTNP